MIPDLPKQAINAALEQDWLKAIELNKIHLDENPKDLDALNRLAFAYLQINKIDKSLKTYNQTLELDPYNSIATKSLKKIALLKSSSSPSNQDLGQPVQTSFLEEPGKTKGATLVRPADSKILARLSIGVPINLTSKKYRISVETNSGVYLGSLPDDLSHRISKLLRQGYKFDAWVKAVTTKTVSIFIKEVFRPKKYCHIPSFPVNNSSKHNFTLISGQSLIEEPLDVTPTGEEDY